MSSENQPERSVHTMTSNKKQPRGKEIIACIRKTVIELCKEKYNSSVEVDGIICICPVGTSTNHVVKIHQTILPADDVPYTDYVAPSEQFDRPTEMEQGWPYNADPTQPSSEPPVDSEVIPVRKKRKYTKYKKSKSEEKTCIENDQVSSKTDEDIENSSGTEYSKNPSEDVSEAKKMKYPFLVHTLCGENGMYLESSRPQVTVENVEGDDVATAELPERELPISTGENKKSAVASLLSNLMIPTQQVTQSTLNTSVNQQDSVKNIPDAVSAVLPAAVPTGDNDEKSNDKDEEAPVPSLSQGVVIKEEPQWDPTDGETSSEYPYKPSNYIQSEEHTSDGDTDSMYRENLNDSETDNSQTTTFTDIQIKQEKPDPEIESIEVERQEPAVQDVEEPNTSKSGQSVSNSILMKILKGKSLKEAYKSEVLKPEDVHVKEEQEELRSKEDQSLVNRLPFASFAELFPGTSQNIPFASELGVEKGKSKMSGSNSNSEDSSRKAFETLVKSANAAQGKSLTLEQGSAFDLLAKSLLSRQKEKKGTSRYSTRLSSGRKNPINYTEMADPASEVESDEDFTATASDGDSEFSPVVVNYGTVSADENQGMEDYEALELSHTVPTTAKSQLSMLLQKKQSRKEPYRSPQLIQSRETATRHLLLFACSICGSEFSTIAERDRHEEEEQYREFVKCPLCNGYFGDEESKRQHMQDRHQVCDKGTVSNTGKSNFLVGPKTGGMLTYHSTQCPMCFIFFKTEQEREIHLCKSHNITVVTEPKK